MVMALETVQDGEAAVAGESQWCPHSAHQPLLLDKLGRWPLLVTTVAYFSEMTKQKCIFFLLSLGMWRWIVKDISAYV